MHKGFLKTAAILGALAIILGAFAVHVLKRYIPEDGIVIFETGVRYQFYHVFAVALAGILFKEYQNRYIKTAGYFFLFGVIFFCGSLYALAFKENLNRNIINFLGPITPVGGFLFIAGWISLIIGIIKRSTNKNE